MNSIVILLFFISTLWLAYLTAKRSKYTPLAVLVITFLMGFIENFSLQAFILITTISLLAGFFIYLIIKH